MNPTAGATVGSPPAPAEEGAPLLAIAGLDKRFNGVPALSGVDLEIDAGEIHGLLGANGCGKSTLIKILAGFHEADGGEVRIGGTLVPQPFGPQGLRERGLTFVHQDLGLSSSATVVEHLALDHAASRPGLGRLDWRSERRRARALLERFGIEVSTDARIEDLSPLQRAMVAVLRAVASQEDLARLHSEVGHHLLILDEPTVFLPRTEVDELFALLGRLRAQGDSVLLVSHDLDEVLAVTDRVTVLRDGRNVGTVRTAGTTREAVVQLILGRTDEHVQRAPVSVGVGGPPVLSVTGLGGRRLRDIDLELRRGEVLGVTGLAGSGFEELPELLYGSTRLASGTISVSGEPVARPAPLEMLMRKVILVPADRKAHASAPTLTVLENIALPFLDDNFEGGRLRWRALRALAVDTCARLGVKPADPDGVFASLSGGNQQKALLGKWMRTNPMVMLLSEPTQGVDIGARREIFRLIRDAVADGMSVLCATSDYEQLVELADRVLVIGDGRIQRTLTDSEITKDGLAAAVYAGGTP